MDSCWRLCAEEIYREIKIHFLTHFSCILLLSAETSVFLVCPFGWGPSSSVHLQKRFNCFRLELLSWWTSHFSRLSNSNERNVLPPFPLFKPLGCPPFITIFVVHIQYLNVYPQINASSLLSFLCLLVHPLPPSLHLSLCQWQHSEFYPRSYF